MTNILHSGVRGTFYRHSDPPEMPNDSSLNGMPCVMYTPSGEVMPQRAFVFKEADIPDGLEEGDPVTCDIEIIRSPTQTHKTEMCIASTLRHDPEACFV